MLSNKIIEELALGTADVETVSGRFVSSIIDYSAKGKVVLSPLFRKVVLPIGRSEAVLPKGSSTVTFQVVSQGGTVSSFSGYRYQGTTVRPVKFGAMLQVDTEALESPERDIFKDMLVEAGSEYARYLDDRARTIALDLTSQSATITTGSLGTFANVPVISITSAGVSTISSVEYDTGIVTLAASIASDTITSLYSAKCNTSGLWMEAASPQTLTVYDILSMRGTLIDNSMNPDIVLVHNSDIPSLIYDATGSNLFVNAREYTDKDELLNGEIGQIMDLKIVSSNYLPQGIGIIVDSSRLGFEITRRELYGEKENKPDYDQVWYHLWSEKEYAVTDNKAVGVIVNLKTGQYPATT